MFQVSYPRPFFEVIRPENVETFDEATQWLKITSKCLIFTHHSEFEFWREKSLKLLGRPIFSLKIQMKHLLKYLNFCAKIQS